MNTSKLNILLKLLDMIKNWMPCFAALYLIIWVIGLFSERLFHLLDRIFGSFPSIFDEIFQVTIDILGRDIPMGYVFMALFCVIIYGILLGIDKAIKKNNPDIDFAVSNSPKPPKKQKEKSLKVQSIRKEIKTKSDKLSKNKPTAKEADITAFYGLLTFELKYLNDDNMDSETQKAIKHSYAKIIVEKLKEKYGSVNYAVSDKVFFICNNVSLFNLFVRDIVKLNKIISITSEKQNIRTALKACFWSAPKANPKEACSLLLRINNLNYLNKIIVSKHIQLKFDKQLIKCFDFCPLGTIKLSKLNSRDNDINMELFYLKTLDN